MYKSPFDLCVDARMLFASGIGTHIRNVLANLPPCRMALLVKEEDFPRIRGQIQGVPIVMKSPIYSIREQMELLQKTPPCDLFWSPHYNIPLFPVRAQKRVVTLHDAAHLAFASLQNWKQNLYARLMFRQAIAKSDQITCVSDFSRQELKKHLNCQDKEIHLIPNGIDRERFSKIYSEKEKSDLNKKYSLPSRFLLFVGNCKPHKNLSLVVKLYQNRLCSLPLVVVGKKEGFLTTDPLVQMIENDQELRKKIHFVGEVLEEELATFYKRAELFLFPSLYEGFGLPPLEAMAASCPVIASKVASLPEVCNDAAHWINPYDVNELAEGIDKILSSQDYRHDLITKGLRQAAQFSWKETARRYQELFNLL